MYRQFAAAFLLIILFVSFLGAVPTQAQGDPTATNTPRPTPTNEGDGPTPTATNTPTSPTTVPPTATNVPSTGGSGGQSNGSIRGTVYEDKNNDGKCVDQNEPALPGIVIRFVSNDGATTVFLESGADGSYGLVAAGLGTWQVSAVPPAGYSVSSAATQSAFISAEQPVALGVNFCVRKGAAAAPGPSVLPASGTLVAPSILALTLTGFGFILVGLTLQWRQLWRKQN
ncbi:MAG: hypothetical protein IPL78_03250 [Chloroflexi bacterium]|nr:hypothetical protein [Chloroflexota bacterium]